MDCNHRKVIDDQAIVTKALLSAADFLGVKHAELSKVVDISPSKLSKMGDKIAHVNENKKEFELALLFIRLYRSLDAIMGGDDAIAQSWLRNYNKALKAIPIDRIKKVEGLVDVVSYLDSRRARI